MSFLETRVHDVPVIDEKPRTHVCQTPPIDVPCWPRAAGVESLTAGDTHEQLNGPEKRSQAPLGTIWICRCLTVWIVESSGWVEASAVVTYRELAQVRRVGI